MSSFASAPAAVFGGVCLLFCLGALGLLIASLWSFVDDMAAPACSVCDEEAR